jgi:hypothetical protein
MVDMMELRDLTTNPVERFILAFDERNIKDNTTYTSVFNVMLLSNTNPCGILIASVRLVRNCSVNWKDQIHNLIEKIMDKFGSVIEPYFLADSHAAHIGLVAPNFKMQVGRHKLKLVPDLFHMFSRLANVLARENASANLFLRMPIGDDHREERVSISFGGDYFGVSTTWQQYRNSSSTDVHWLLKLYSQRILDDTLANMSPENYPHRDERGQVFEELMWFIRRFSVNNEITRSEESRLSGKLQFLFSR